MSQPQVENSAMRDFVSAEGTKGIRRNGYACAFQAGEQTANSALPIRVKPGERVHPEINPVLVPFYSVTFTVQDPSGHAFVPDMNSDEARNNEPLNVEILNGDHQLTCYEGKYEGEKGVIQAELPNGSYVLRIFVNQETAGPALMGNSQNGYIMGLLPFTVAGHPKQNIPVSLFLPTTHLLRVQNTSQSTKPVGEADQGEQSLLEALVASANDPLYSIDHEFHGESVGDDYNLMFNPTSSQWLSTQAAPGNCFASIAASGWNPARDPFRSDPTSENLPIDMQLRNDCAGLKMTLPGNFRADAPGVIPVFQVYVVPDFDTTEDASEITVSQADADATELNDLTPGRYTIYTFSEPVELPYRDASAMAAMKLTGQHVELAPNERKQIQLEIQNHP